MNPQQLENARARTRDMLAKAGIILTPAESAGIEIVELGLGRLDEEGLEIVTYINNARYCAKELVLFPRQTCPEHRHPTVASETGKTETFRVRRGIAWLYIEGPATSPIHARIPQHSIPFYTVFHEIELRPGQQFTIPPNTLHWFQSGDDGAIVSEFSSASRDEFDIFTNPHIVRVAK